MTKLQILAKQNDKFEDGFKLAFSMISEAIEKEIKLVENFPWQGERRHTLNIYKKQITNILKEMEQEV